MITLGGNRRIAKKTEKQALLLLRLFYNESVPTEAILSPDQ